MPLQFYIPNKFFLVLRTTIYDSPLLKSCCEMLRALIDGHYTVRNKESNIVQTCLWVITNGKTVTSLTRLSVHNRLFSPAPAVCWVIAHIGLSEDSCCQCSGPLVTLITYPFDLGLFNWAQRMNAGTCDCLLLIIWSMENVFIWWKLMVLTVLTGIRAAIVFTVRARSSVKKTTDRLIRVLPSSRRTVEFCACFSLKATQDDKIWKRV